jgi:hypothetical protein
MFGRHNSTITDPDGTVVDERGERIVSSPDGTRSEGRVAGPADRPDDTASMPRADQTVEDRTGRVSSEPVVTEPVVTEPVVTEPVVTEPAAEQREADAAREAADEQAANDRTETLPAGEPVTEPVSEPVADTKRWAHVSAMAMLSLIVGTLAVAATLTGLLAPIGFAAGVLAILIGIIALYAVRRPGVTGHTLVGLGVLFGLVAIVLSVLAMNDSLSWLSSKTDEVATVHTWLNDHMHWLRRW